MIGFIRCELFIGEPQSLKEKRSIMKRLTVTLRQRYNVSVAETAYQDLWQRAELSLCVVSSHKKGAEAVLTRALAHIDSETAVERTVTNWEWL
ncbi:DUF503 domain-containing protein [Shouchella lonarensis]|uniref:YlxP-like protein n=1 Tax=Shouchella lonarensis TaxID=1464122 RepID=A0A1G6HA30_9BACI|nr:DUF503 family protein [Shouchella lonarensis]SDB90296.1 hypothetical protein SAMN05421737_10341 [Shouchella lonarensis]